MIKLDKFNDEEFKFIRNSFANWFDNGLITGFNIYNRVVYPDVEIPFNYLHGIKEHKIVLSDEIKSIKALEDLIKDIENQTFRRSALYIWEKDFMIPKEKDGLLKKGFGLMLFREGTIFLKDDLDKIATLEEIYQEGSLVVAIEDSYDISFPVNSKEQAIEFIRFLNENVFMKKIDEKGLVIRDRFGKPREDNEKYLFGSYTIPLIVFNDRFNLFSRLDTFTKIRKMMLYRDKNEVSFCIDRNYKRLKNTIEFKKLKDRFEKDFYEIEIYANNEFIRHVNKSI